ncbi:MAG: methyltransferase [Candidatus Aenigmarchaeota archaeon]|nr:methyltransferase [Candidatus Aenigmarchaeota archaeon]
MDFKKNFMELSSFLKEYSVNLVDYNTEPSQFLLNLDEADYNALIHGFSLSDAGAPKSILDMESASREVSGFENVYAKAKPFANPEETGVFKNLKRRSVEESFNFAKTVIPFLGDKDFVLEVASGGGHLSRYLYHSLSGTRVAGVDKSGPAVAESMHRAHENGMDITYFLGDVMEEDIGVMLDGKRNAVVSLHGCGNVSNRILSAENADLIAVSPCCYHKIKDNDYFVSGYASSKRTEFDGGTICSVASSGIGFFLPSERNRKREEVYSSIVSNGYNISDEYTGILDAAGKKVPSPNTENIDRIVDVIHGLKKRHSLMRKLICKPAESLLSTDKAIYLQERGYDANVVEYVPVILSPRNHLVMGYR